MSSTPKISFGYFNKVYVLRDCAERENIAANKKFFDEIDGSLS